jgi:ankyrin repeat protein
MMNILAAPSPAVLSARSFAGRPKGPLVNPLACDAEGKTALLRAAEWGRLSELEDLLGAPGGAAAVNTKNSNGTSPLQRAAREGHTKVVRELIAAGAAIDAVDRHGKTALARAAEWGHDGALALLLTLGANLAARDAAGNAPIDLAARNRRDYATRTLALFGADTGANSGAALAAAAARGDTAAVRHLLVMGYADAGAARDKAGRTALECVPKHCGYVDTWLALLRARVAQLAAAASTAAAGGAGGGGGCSGSAPAEATAAGELTAAGISLNERLRAGKRPGIAGGGETALLLASAEPGGASVVRTLLAAGASPRATRLKADGRTALHAAAACGDGDTAAALLLAGASVNARTRERATPLLAAAAAGHASTVATLLAARGRFLNARDASGLTPLAHARRAGHADAAKLLEAAGAKL